MDPNPLAINDPTVLRDGSCLNHSQSISDFLSKNSTTNKGQPTRLGSMTQPCRFHHASG